MLSPYDIRTHVEAVIRAAGSSLSSYDILERLPDIVRSQIIAERGLPGAGSGNPYSAASLVTDAVELLLPAREPPYRVYRDVTGITFTVAGHVVQPGNSNIAFYWLPFPESASQKSPDAPFIVKANKPVDSYVLPTDIETHDNKIEKLQRKRSPKHTETDAGQTQISCPTCKVISTYFVNAALESENPPCSACGSSLNCRFVKVRTASSRKDGDARLYSIRIKTSRGIEELVTARDYGSDIWEMKSGDIVSLQYDSSSNLLSVENHTISRTYIHRLPPSANGCGCPTAATLMLLLAWFAWAVSAALANR